MSNILSKLNATLEHRLEVLTSKSLTGERLQEQLQINKAIVETSREITSVHKIALDATKLEIEYGNRGLVSNDLKDVSQLRLNEVKE